jgi:hypothetical protein
MRRKYIHIKDSFNCRMMQITFDARQAKQPWENTGGLDHGALL